MKNYPVIPGNRRTLAFLTAISAGWACALLLGWTAVSPCAAPKPNLPKEIDQAVREAERKLTLVEGNVRMNQFETAQQALIDYKGLLDDALPKAKEYFVGRVKTPGILKDDEIRLRKQIRRLSDIRQELPIPVRADLDAASDSAEALRKQLFRELLAPSGKK